MPNTTVLAAGEAMPAADIDLNTVQSDVWHLYHLIDATVGCLMEMTYVRDGKRDTELDRIASLAWIARDCSERIGKTIDENFRSIETGVRA